jgi:hypothetical protein
MRIIHEIIPMRKDLSPNWLASLGTGPPKFYPSDSSGYGLQTFGCDWW